jgi:hypothetical protein
LSNFAQVKNLEMKLLLQNVCHLGHNLTKMEIWGTLVNKTVQKSLSNFAKVKFRDDITPQ